VIDIIHQFQTQIEHSGQWRLFWTDDEYVKEKYAQNLFRLVATILVGQYNNLNKNSKIDISPETHNGNGSVDMKFSNATSKVPLGIKMSYHKKTSKWI
jgi:hypothetical protein